VSGVNRLMRTAAVVALAASLVGGATIAPASATPSGQAAALSKLKSAWNKLPAETRKGTCQEYGKWPNSTLVNATNAAWTSKRNHANMTIGEWLTVFKAFYKWAC